MDTTWEGQAGSALLPARREGEAGPPSHAAGLSGARRVAIGVLSWGHSQPSLLSKLEPPLASTARAGHWVPPGGG